MPHLICFAGSLGAGKTTGASLFAWLWKNEIERRGGHAELFANYDLYGAHRMDAPEDWYTVAEAHGSICVWDEAHRTFDSRRYARLENIVGTELLTFVRKMASIQIFATPSIMRLDTRIREIMEILVIVRKTAAGTYYDFYDYQADFAGRYGRFLHSKFLPRSKMRMIHDLNLFDTHSFVSKFPLPTTEPAARRFMAQLEEAHIRGLERAKERGKVHAAVLSTA